MLTSRQKWTFVFIGLILVVCAGLSQLTPLAIGYLTDSVLSRPEIVFVEIIPILAWILLVNIVNEVLKVSRRLLVESVATSLESHARTRATEALLRAPLSYFRTHLTGNIHGRLNRALEGVVRLVKLMFMDFAPAICSGLAAIVVLFAQLPWTLATLSLLVIPIGLLLVWRQITTQAGIRVDLLAHKATMDGSLVELLGGIESIRVFDMAAMETKRQQDQSEKLRRREMIHHRAMAFYDCLKFINEAVFSVVVIAWSVWLAASGEISVGAVLTAYICFTQLLGPLRELHRILDELSESRVLAAEYFAISDLEPDFSYRVIDDKKQRLHNGQVDIQHLSLSYPEKPEERIINDLDLTIESGRFIGIAGPSGGGKSSFIKALTKLEPIVGHIKLGGVDIGKLDRSELARDVVLIPQQPFLIADTIAHNITYGLSQKVSRQQLTAAAERAYLTTTIAELPDGYDFMVAEGGRNLSGGQRQRIALARIFLRQPKILILDEATSALDNTSEKFIQEQIEKLQAETGVTVISIAHRLSTLRHCDEILVIANGRIAERGSYEELSHQSGLFAQMLRGGNTSVCS